MEEVVLVTEEDLSVGCMEKELAHRCGALHRAISVCLFDGQGRWLLQQRSSKKYHSPLKWSNSCCGHPRPGELPQAAAERRLFEEIGVYCPLTLCTSFVYRADVGGGMVEHEFDYLFIGQYNGSFSLNAEEVQQVSWQTTEEIKSALKGTPELFTPWFPLIFDRVLIARPSKIV